MKLKARQLRPPSRYGWGKILEDEAKRTIVYFRNVGIKKFATSRAAFALIAGQAHKRLPFKPRFRLIK